MIHWCKKTRHVKISNLDSPFSELIKFHFPGFSANFQEDLLFKLIFNLKGASGSFGINRLCADN